jgi:hypothetical protein
LAVLAWLIPRMGLVACIVTFAMAAAVWLMAKRHMLRRDRYKVPHVHT